MVNNAILMWKIKNMRFRIDRIKVPSLRFIMVENPCLPERKNARVASNWVIIRVETRLETWSCYSATLYCTTTRDFCVVISNIFLGLLQIMSKEENGLSSEAIPEIWALPVPNFILIFYWPVWSWIILINPLFNFVHPLFIKTFYFLIAKNWRLIWVNTYENSLLRP